MTQNREFKAAGLGAGVVALYMAFVLGTGRVDLGMFGRLLSFYINAAFSLWTFVLGFAVLAMMVIEGRKSGGEPFLVRFVTTTVRDRWQRDRFVSLVWPPLLFATLLASFNSFKQMVLPLAGFSWDPMLAAADKALFLGVDPWRVTHAVLGSPEATIFVDRAYHGWFVPMSLGLIACAFMPSTTYRLRTQYMLSYIGVWIIIGSVFAWLMPSAGPCFYEIFVGSQPSYHELLQRLHQAQAETGSVMTSLNNQRLLIGLHNSDKLVIGGGISAMPSVHNGLAALFALAAFRLHRGIGWFVAGYAALIWLGSIHLGWHYALDGLVAFCMTFVLWIVSGRIADAFDREDVAEEPAPAVA